MAFERRKPPSDVEILERRGSKNTDALSVAASLRFAAVSHGITAVPSLAPSLRGGATINGTLMALYLP